MGKLEIYAADELVNEVDLIIKEDVEAGWFPSYVGISNLATMIICGVITLLLVFFIWVSAVKAKYRRKKQRIRQRKIMEMAMAEMRKEQDYNEETGIFNMFDIKENLKNLPDCPGVYLHKDRLGQVIYVGKAISLRNQSTPVFSERGEIQSQGGRHGVPYCGV